MEPSHYVCDDMQWNGTSNSPGSKGLFIYLEMHFRGGGGGSPNCSYWLSQGGGGGGVTVKLTYHSHRGGG